MMYAHLFISVRFRFCSKAAPGWKRHADGFTMKQIRITKRLPSSVRHQDNQDTGLYVSFLKYIHIKTRKFGLVRRADSTVYGES